MSYQNEWLLFEAEDEFDEIKHREPTEELLSIVQLQVEI